MRLEYGVHTAAEHAAEKSLVVLGYATICFKVHTLDRKASWAPEPYEQHTCGRQPQYWNLAYRVGIGEAEGIAFEFEQIPAISQQYAPLPLMLTSLTEW
jgi:hypothetical protein